MNIKGANAIALTTIFATTLPTVAGEPDASLLSVYESMEIDMDPSDYTIHDPSQIITVGNIQMIAVTGKAQEDGYDCGLETWWRHNDDQGHWQPGQCLFRTKPDWVEEETPLNDGAFWAPELDLIEENDTLTLLYSISEMGEGEDGENTCVGVAKSTTDLEGFPDNLTWEDVGEPLTCIHWPGGGEEERSAIDPSVFWGFGDHEDELYLVTGGGRIIGTALDPETYLQIDGEWFDIDGDDWTELSTGPDSEDDTWVEAAYIHPNPKTGYYYLFVNWGGCCNGVDSTYEIRVGRSRNPMGPYLDKDGHDMMEGGGTLLVETEDYIIGPGHTGIHNTGCVDILSFHYYDGRRDGNSWIGEKLLTWSRGWPIASDFQISEFPDDMPND